LTAGLLRAGAELVGGNQPRHCGFDESHFRLLQEHVHLRAAARAVLSVRFSGQGWRGKTGCAADGRH
jgi:hypothetical protein